MWSYGFSIQPKLIKNPENLINDQKMTVILVYTLIRAEPGFDIDITNAHTLSVALVFLISNFCINKIAKRKNRFMWKITDFFVYVLHMKGCAESGFTFFHQRWCFCSTISWLMTSSFHLKNKNIQYWFPIRRSNILLFHEPDHGPEYLANAGPKSQDQEGSRPPRKLDTYLIFLYQFICKFQPSL